MKKFILFFGLALAAALSFASPSDLLVLQKDIVVEQRGSDWRKDGVDLYIRKKDGMESVMLVETTKDPSGKMDNFAYRALEYDSVNGDEIRYLDGKVLKSEYSKYSLISSTVVHHDSLGKCFHIYIPPVLVYGYPWERHGTVSIEKGLFINIRTFAKKYGDYSGKFQDNPFMFDYRAIETAAKQTEKRKVIKKQIVKKPVKKAKPVVKEEPEKKESLPLPPEPVIHDELPAEPEPVGVPEEKEEAAAASPVELEAVPEDSPDEKSRSPEADYTDDDVIPLYIEEHKEEPPAAAYVEEPVSDPEPVFEEEEEEPEPEYVEEEDDEPEAALMLEEEEEEEPDAEAVEEEEADPVPPIMLTDDYNPDAAQKFNEIADKGNGFMTYSRGPETLPDDLDAIIQSMGRKDVVDIVLAIDTTGSMKDDLDSLRKVWVPRLLDQLQDFGDVRFGLLLYRDYHDGYIFEGLPVKVFNFTSSQDELKDYLDSVKIRGNEGGDIPEAVYEALYASLRYYEWREEAEKKIILIGDAGPHPRPRGSKKISQDMVIKLANEKNISLDCVIVPDDKKTARGR